MAGKYEEGVEAPLSGVYSRIKAGTTREEVKAPRLQLAQQVADGGNFFSTATDVLDGGTFTGALPPYETDGGVF